MARAAGAGFVADLSAHVDGNVHLYRPVLDIFAVDGNYGRSFAASPAFGFGL